MNVRAARITAVMVMLAGCASGTESSRNAPVDSGITGVVLAGPTCPVEVEPVDGIHGRRTGACADRPIAAVVRVLDPHSGDVVATTRSDPAGRFSVTVGSGEYEAQALAADSIGRGQPQSVTVRLGAKTRITLYLDTGIR